MSNYYEQQNSEFMDRQAKEIRLQEINDSWGDMSMSAEEAEASQKEYDELYLQLHPEIDQANDGTCLNHVADSWGACENCGRLVF